MNKIDKSVICQLINASIEDESKAGHEYAEILEAIPKDEEYKECAEAILKIMEDETNHFLILIRIGKSLGCKEPSLSKEDKDFFKVSNHIHKIKIKH